MTVQTRMIEGADHTYHIHRTQDVAPILEYTRAMHNEGAGNGKDMKHAAEFPSVIVENYMNTHGVSFNEILNNPVHVNRMLSDPALSGFRIWAGKV